MAIQDTTELNYTSHKALKGAGYLDSKYASGLKVHSTLSLNTTGVPLGIIGQHVWARDTTKLGKAEVRHQKPTSEKESQRWLNALIETDSIIPESTQVVTIADTEADFYDLFACPRRQGADFLIRATQNRCLVGSDDHLWETMESVTPQGTMMVEIKRNPNHYVLKSGCQIEKLQLKTAQRLEMALATYSIVAWRLLWLTYMARRDPDSSCEEVFATYEWQSLYATIHKQIYTDDTPPTLAQVIGWIARLGGFLGRKCDGFPGVKVLWRGLRRLNDIAQTWLLCQSLSSYTS